MNKGGRQAGIRPNVCWNGNETEVDLIGSKIPLI